MKKNYFFFILLAVLIFPLSTVHTQGTFDEIREQLKVPQPRIEIPGVKFTPIKDIIINESDDGSGRKYISIPFLGEYIVATYRYGAILISILAVITIMLAGLRWMLPGNVITNVLTKAGGEKQEDQINKAKEQILKSIGALVLVMTSYAFLNFLNPNLVKFRNLDIVFIERSEFDGSEATGEKESTDPSRCGGAVGHEQTLFPGLDGSIHKYASYSTKFGPTCKTQVIPKAIILHYTAGDKGTPAGIVKWWSGPDSPGTICQIILDRKGIGYQVTNSIEEKVICHGSKGFNWNTGGIGIEVMGKNEKQLQSNTVQKDKLVLLVKSLASRYGIPITNDVKGLINGKGGIFTHEQVTKCLGATHRKEDLGEDYAKEILEKAGGVYLDWTINSSCDK
jgi:hypothetical protein